MRIGDELRADESIMSLKESLWFSQLVEIVGVSLDVVIGTDEKTGCSCRRILHYLAGLRLHRGRRPDTTRTDARYTVRLGPVTSEPTTLDRASLVGKRTEVLRDPLAIQGNQLAVYLDGVQMMSVTDVEAQPYASGALSLDMYTGATGYAMSVDDVLVTRLASA